MKKIYQRYEKFATKWKLQHKLDLKPRALALPSSHLYKRILNTVPNLVEGRIELDEAEYDIKAWQMRPEPKGFTISDLPNMAMTTIQNIVKKNDGPPANWPETIGFGYISLTNLSHPDEEWELLELVNETNDMAYYKNIISGAKDVMSGAYDRRREGLTKQQGELLNRYKLLCTDKEASFPAFLTDEAIRQLCKRHDVSFHIHEHKIVMRYPGYKSLNKMFDYMITLSENIRTHRSPELVT